MRKRSLLTACLLTVARFTVTPGQATPPAPTPITQASVLKVGALAPPLQVDRWVKGGPIPELKRGEIYVVEFWATWCSPCRASIPHLSELARKYQGKVTFIGVNIWEPASLDPAKSKVEAFVKAQGDGMAYNVCVDTKDGAMGNGWMKASASMGIPQAFIIDKTGHIAFMGQPMVMETALDLIVAGTFDLKTAAASLDWDMAEMKEAMDLAKATRQLNPALEKALAAKDGKQVRQLLDQAEATFPELKDHPAFARSMRFRALASEAPDRAKAILEAGLTPASTTVEYWVRVQALRKVWQDDRRWADLALTYLARMEAKDPFRAPMLAPVRFQALLNTDRAKALTTLQAASKGPWALSMAMDVADTAGLPPVWYETILPILEEGTKDDHAAFPSAKSLAVTFARLGRFREAAELQEKVVDHMKKDSHQQAGVEAAEQLLKKYQAASN